MRRRHSTLRYRHLWRRVRRVYGCSHTQGKSIAETTLEYTAKHLLPRAVYTALLKVLLRRYRLSTNQSLSRALTRREDLPSLLTRRGFTVQRFFFATSDATQWAAYTARFRDQWPAIVEQADALRRHEFDLLGSGVCHWGDPIDWRLDPKSGYRWPKIFFPELAAAPSPDHADVKLPFELSRLQHFPTLGKAYRITKNEAYARELAAQVEHWLDDNPCHTGINWRTAMDVALRVVNLLWGLAFIDDSPALTAPLKERIWRSLWEHGQYLVRHLEFSVRPDGSLGNHNHYLSNLVGLVYLGVLFPEFQAATTWRRIGVQGLIEAMERQVLPDGVNYESSTTYHRLVLECFTSAALVCRLNGIVLPEAFWSRLENMYAFTMHATRPDGMMPQIGDADDGRVHILSDYGHWERNDHRYLLSIGAALFQRTDMKAQVTTFSEEAFWLLGPESAAAFDALPRTPQALNSIAFPAAGFYVMRQDKHYLLACCNAVGTAGAGQHKHNDLLSFELCLQGVPFIVDPGAYIYTADPCWRNHFRSTRSHNTVRMDQQEQNRFKPHTVFGVMADAAPLIHDWRSTDTDDWLDAEHTGYQRLAHPVSHRRTFHFDKRAIAWRITDVLTSTGEHTAEWFFHFDAGIAVEQIDDIIFKAWGHGQTLYVLASSSMTLEARIAAGWVSRRYGVKYSSQSLIFKGIVSSFGCVTFDLRCTL